MNKIIIVLISSVATVASYAQQQFIVKGKIEYEKKTNLHKLLPPNSFGETMKKSIPQFKNDYFDLYFSENKTLYKPGKEVAGVKVPDFVLGPANDNVVFSDINENKFITQKVVFDNTFLIQDSLRKIEWKITQDTRTIAGFECRKATAVIMDSIYVVAFYTEQILTTGGPESFTGLPGMILGLGLPRLNTTWFATKLEVIEVKDTDLVAPKKGKKTNMVDLDKQFKASMKDWGKEADRFIWRIFI